MGHIEEIVEREGEKKPYIVIDMLLRIHALPGTEIMLSDVRHLIYYLRDDLRFRVTGVSLDGFQSTDTLQQLRKKRMSADYVSVDKSTLPYEDLREAIYERRFEFPPYKTYLFRGSTDRVEIAVQELMRLQFDGKKVDHPADGSKDVADAMAGVCYMLMGDRNYRKGVTSISEYRDRKEAATGTDGKASIEDLMPRLQGYGMHAPVPPLAGGDLGVLIPRHLRPR